ncbi:MAG: CmpA/NrtA family ABC transporter substrate-binding protein [Limnobacter sp.]|nr:CmpA/NrtA family ABC transporter substrate-binding protein [Limnobacter sp.]
MSASVKIGVLALTDSAPLVVAEQLGWYEEAGVNVELHHQTSWATLRDKLIYGQLNMAHMLAPLAVAIEKGFGLSAAHFLATPLVLNRGGNGVTISKSLKSLLKGLGVGDTLGSAVRARLEAGQAKLIVGTVFPFSMHTLQLRRWLRLHDIDPDMDARFQVVPPLKMTQALREGKLDLFCVGEPWNTVAQEEGSGEIVSTSQLLWPEAPEKILCATASWAKKEAGAYAAVMDCVSRACKWLEQGSENRLQAAKWMARTDYVNVPESLLAKALLADRGTGGGLQPFMTFAGDPVVEQDPNWSAMVSETVRLMNHLY